jgi:hypothetical protein
VHPISHVTGQFSAAPAFVQRLPVFFLLINLQYFDFPLKTNFASLSWQPPVIVGGEVMGALVGGDVTVAFVGAGVTGVLVGAGGEAPQLSVACPVA